jgi:hypothetical protein
MESRANDLSRCQQRLFGNSGVLKSPEERRLHKTCSADAAMMCSSESQRYTEAVVTPDYTTSAYPHFVTEHVL